MAKRKPGSGRIPLPKNKVKVPLGFRMRPDVVAKARKEAEECMVSPSTYVSWLIVDADVTKYKSHSPVATL